MQRGVLGAHTGFTKAVSEQRLKYKKAQLSQEQKEELGKQKEEP